MNKEWSPVEEAVMLPRTFVVPLDGSAFAERALDVAQAFATRVEGRILALSTHWDHDARTPYEYLDRIVHQETGVPIESTVIRDRKPADAIALALSEAPDRVVCMTTHGRGGVRWAMLGSVAEDVVQASTRPIILVGRHCEADAVRGRGPLLVGVDGSEASEAIAIDATEWAAQLGLELRVAVVIHPLDVEDAQHPDALLQPIAARFEQRGAHVEPELLRNTYVAGALADHAQTIGASMLAMTKRSKSIAGRIALGSVTMAAVHAAPCPLLVTRAAK